MEGVLWVLFWETVRWDLVPGECRFRWKVQLSLNIFDENIENGSILKLFCFAENYSFGKTGRNSKLSK